LIAVVNMLQIAVVNTITTVTVIVVSFGWRNICTMFYKKVALMNAVCLSKISHITYSQDSSVSIVTNYELDGQGIGV
jgi:hypothetical protein